MALLAISRAAVIFSLGIAASWKDQHPQQRYRIHSLRLPCYSCMSPYLEDHYPYISHLYRKPLSFDPHCDRNNLDRSYLFVKNCSDMCVTLRINDVVGGRRRHGYVRGCLSDIHGYNHSLIRALADQSGCLDTTARQLFMPTALRQELEPSRLAICGCHSNLCNSSPNPLGPLTSVLGLTSAVVLVLLLRSTTF
uniref:Protein quiver n=1 Tax=Haemonchus contortus TaxID=6289 RepID=A0A7I4Z0H1_HAECO